MIGVALQLKGHKYTRSEQRGKQMEKEEANADEIRDSVNSTGSLSLTDRLEQVGTPQVIEQVRFRFKDSLLGGKANESLQTGVMLGSSTDFYSAAVSCEAG